jgi:hypothetical protein
MFPAIPYNKPFLSQAAIFAQEDVKLPLLNFLKMKGNVSKKKQIESRPVWIWLIF